MACEHLEEVGELGYLSSMGPYLAEAVLAQGRDEEALQLTDRWRADRLTVPEDADGQTQWRRVRAEWRPGELWKAFPFCREEKFRIPEARKPIGLSHTKRQVTNQAFV